MVMSCSAYKCPSIANPHANPKISFHGFPFKRPEVFKLWLAAVGRDKWYPSKSSKLCGAHFQPSDFQTSAFISNKLLKPKAVPSVFQFHQRLLRNRTEPQRILVKCFEIKNILSETDQAKIGNEMLQSLANTYRKPILIDEETQTETEIDNEFCYLQMQLKNLKQKIKQRDMEISSMEGIIRKHSKQ